MELGIPGWKLVTAISLASGFAAGWLAGKLLKQLICGDVVRVKVRGNKITCPHCGESGKFDLVVVHDDDFGREYLVAEWERYVPCYHLALAEVGLDENGDVIFVVEREFGE
jgi:hypothetical protein